MDNFGRTSRDKNNKFLIQKKNSCKNHKFQNELQGLISHYESLANSAGTPEKSSYYTQIKNRLIAFRVDADTTNIFRVNSLAISMEHDKEFYNLIDLDKFFEVSRHNLSFVNFEIGKIYQQEDFHKIQDELAVYWRDDFPFDFNIRSDALDSVDTGAGVEIEGEVEYIEISQGAQEYHINTAMRVVGFVKESE